MSSNVHNNSDIDYDTAPADVLSEANLRRGYMLGSIIVYPYQDVLVKDDIHHHLSRHAMELLFALSCNAGQVMSRQELLVLVWGDGNTKDAKLSKAMAEIRQVLDDHKSQARYIQTLPRQGFRLIMPVLPLDEELLTTEMLLFTAEESRGDSQTDKGRKKHRNLQRWRRSRLFKIAGAYIVMAWVLMQVVSVTLPILHAPKWLDSFVLLILIVCLPLVLLVSWWGEMRLRQRYIKQQNIEKGLEQLKRRANRDLIYIAIIGLVSSGLSYAIFLQIINPPKNIQSPFNDDIFLAEVAQNGVAVMPFRQLGMNNVDYSVEVLQSELLTFLSQSSQLLVTAERVVAGLPDNAPLSMIRMRTGATYVLEGVVSVAKDQLQITTMLTDTGSGHQVWANKTVAGLTERLQLHETLSRQVYNALTFLMPQDESQQLKFKPTEDIQAYDYYVQAKTKLKEAYSETQLKRVEQLFLLALRHDSEFELAEAGLCQTYLEMYGVTKITQVFELAQQTCQKRKATSNLRAESEIALGQLYYESGEYEPAIRQFSSAIELQPNNSKALTGMARAMAMMDAHAGAETLFLRAIKVEPGYWHNYERYGSFLFSLGRYKEASFQFQKQSVLQPDSEEAYNNLGAAFYLDTEFEKATQNWQRALAIKPSANLYSNLGTSLFFSQKFSQAAQMYEQAVKLNGGDFVLKSNLADAYKYMDKQQENAKRSFLAALEQAKESEKINDNDPLLKAHIARLSAELGDCHRADLYSQKAQENLSEDPYLFYWLALASTKCNTQQQVLNFLRSALTHGYPHNLLNRDHQFAQYQPEIKLMPQKLASKSL